MHEAKKIIAQKKLFESENLAHAICTRSAQLCAIKQIHPKTHKNVHKTCAKYIMKINTAA